MRKTVRALAALALAGALAYVAPAGASAPGTEDYNINKADVRNCKTVLGEDSNRTIAYNGPIALWPPSHEYYDKPVWITVSGLATDRVRATTAAGHDQIEGDVELVGSGHTMDDITPTAWSGEGTGSVTSPNFQIRSERSGLVKDGRTYFISVDAWFNEVQCETETFEIVVPHDMRISTRS